MKRKRMMMMSSSSSSQPSYCLSLLPEDLIINEILLKLPLSSLLRLRCVSRYLRSLITSPSFVMKHLDHSTAQPNLNLLLITCKYVCPYKNIEVFQHYSCNFSTGDDPSFPEVVEMPCPFESAGIWGSCNGLLLLHGTNKKNGYLWNPFTKEYKELPTPTIIRKHVFRGIQVRSSKRLYPSSDLFKGIEVKSSKQLYSSSGFCGFGYDHINDEYKILYHESYVDQLPNDVIRSNDDMFVIQFKLYTLGTNTWTSINCDNLSSINCDNPYRYLFFGSQRKSIGLFVSGALHWIMSSTHTSSCASNDKIISFDIEKEEFQEVQKPQYSLEFEEEDYNYEVLEVLQGCLCLCQFSTSNFTTTDIWVLKDYTVKDSWTRVFTIVNLNDLVDLRLLRVCENGEIIMRGRRKNLIVYDPVNHDRCRPVENIDEYILERWEHEVIYVQSLVSLNSGTYSI